MEIVSVKSELTRWDQEGRIQGNIDIPLCEAGVARARLTGSELASMGIKLVYSGTSMPVYQTACIISEGNGRVSVTRKPELDEVDFGLWQGLLDLDLRRKHRRIYNKWLTDPASIEPPSGERLDEAFGRIVGGIEGIMRAKPGKRVMVVTGPYAFALVACYFKDSGLGPFWDMYRDSGKRWELYTA